MYNSSMLAKTAVFHLKLVLQCHIMLSPSIALALNISSYWLVLTVCMNDIIFFLLYLFFVGVI